VSGVVRPSDLWLEGFDLRIFGHGEGVYLKGIGEWSCRRKVYAKRTGMNLAYYHLSRVSRSICLSSAIAAGSVLRCDNLVSLI